MQAMQANHAATPADPMLFGALRLVTRGPVALRPALVCEPYCPFCRGYHEVDWPDGPDALGAVRAMKSPCASGPFAGRSVLVGLDPGRREDHCRVVREFDLAMRRWSSGRAFHIPERKAEVPAPAPKPRRPRRPRVVVTRPPPPEVATSPPEKSRPGEDGPAAWERDRLDDLLAGYAGIFEDQGPG